MAKNLPPPPRNLGYSSFQKEEILVIKIPSFWKEGWREATGW
jgi:hypothetical protein